MSVFYTILNGTSVWQHEQERGVNYRGSTGFGANFLRLGMNGEFYKTLQDDIEDCIEYATSPYDAEEDSLYA